MNKKGYILSKFQTAAANYPQMYGEYGVYEIRLVFGSSRDLKDFIGNPNSYNEWNTRFDLPAYGSPFVGVYRVADNEVRLYTNGLITLRSYLFQFYQIIQFHDISGAVISIGESCFYQSNIHYITFPEVRGIDNWGFYNCYNLTSASFPKCETIGMCAFLSCHMLNSIYFPEVRSISAEAFKSCYTVQYFDFPKCTQIQHSCFAYCSQMVSLNIPMCNYLGSYTSGNEAIFMNINNMGITLTVPSVLMTCNSGNPDGDIQWLQANNTVTVVVVEGLELEFDSIANVPVADPANVDQWNTFFDLPNYGTPFNAIGVLGNKVYLYGAENISLKQNLFNNNSHLISVNDKVGCVTLISAFCFYQCVKLNFISFDNCITIGDASFNSCYVLPQVTFPNVITAGNNAFFSCNILNEAIFPKLESAGDGTFSYCPLSVVDFSSLKNAGTSCFGYSNVSMSAFPVLENAGLGCFWNSSVDGDLIFPKLATIGRMCFYNRTGSITEINIPACINLGGSSALNDVFGGISGKTITLTIPTALMSCNGGNPDGDITDLQSRNTVTIYQTNIKYGALYNFYALENINGFAPDGWHVPVKTEWEDLITELGGTSIAGQKMKENNSAYWNPYNFGDNESGFSARGSGFRKKSDGLFSAIQNNCLMWSTTPYLTYIYYAHLYGMSSSFEMNNAFLKGDGISVRFIRDDDTGWVEGEQLIDQDDNIYDTVRIGTQIWTVQNYACTKYKNGTAIANITDNTAWINDTSGAYCWYNNDISNK